MLTIFIITLVFIFAWQIRADKMEKLRFREFVIATKSKNIESYKEATEELPDIKVKPEDEVMDMSDVDPQKLIRSINKMHESNEDQI